jgi:polysaccharide biosynthesis/export protein
VDVAGSFEFDWRGGLTPEGFLNGLERSPEQIYALCRSESAVAEDIARHYGVFLREPRVTVRILDRSGRAVAVLDGAVKRAYRFRIGRAVRLSELLALSGGITDDAGGEITILRSPASNCEPHPGETRAASTRTIRITDMLEGAEGSNPYIVAGDDIRVVEALPIYLIGGIEVPRPIKARPGISLSRAVAMAGGLTKSAVAANVTIFRREGNARRTLKADLTEISAGRADDCYLSLLTLLI